MDAGKVMTRLACLRMVAREDDEMVAREDDEDD